jgi:shikimate kinase
MLTTLSPNDQNLILTGYAMPGQLAIARHVSEKLRMKLVDFGAHFEERAGMTADDLKALYGDARLRALETTVVGDIALHRAKVIHISGQVLSFNGHYDMLRSTGVVIALVASLDAVLQRLHLALGARYHDPRERAAALAMLRREWAIRAADGLVELDTTALSEESMIDAIIERWRALSGVIDWRRG